MIIILTNIQLKNKNGKEDMEAHTTAEVRLSKYRFSN